MRAQLDGEFTNEMIECRFAGVVRFTPLLRYDRIRRTSKDHCSWQTLFFENPIGLTGEEVIPSHIDKECFGPLRIRKVSVGAWNRIDSSGIHDNIDAPEFRDSK